MDLPSLADVILVIVLLIPGFIALSLFRWFAILERKLSDYQLIIWSLFFSLFIYAIFSWHTGISSIDSMRDSMLIPGNLHYAKFFLKDLAGPMLMWEVSFERLLNVRA